MKKKFAGLALAAVVLVAPAAADAATIGQRLAKVEAKLACLQYAGLSEWTGYTAYYDGSEVTAASFDTAQGYPHSVGDYRVLVVKDTATCRPKFGAAPNYYGGLGLSARTSAVQSKLEKIHVS